MSVLMPTDLMKTKFNDNAEIVLDKRYHYNGEDSKEMLWRCALGNEEYYNMMASLDFLPNSPTLFNLGTGKGTYSACFKYDIKDSMDSIMDVARKAALVQKWGGGVGYYFGNLRAKGAEVKGTGNHAGGPVAFLRMYNAIGDCITQSGKRAAAQMGILPAWHPDIEEWITCKSEDPDSLSTFNISVSLTDEFMNYAAKGGEFQAEKVLDMIAQAAWKTGDPGVYFVDTSERTNPTPHLGKLTGTNPCGEVPLLDNEPCNLGSINLRNFVRREAVVGDISLGGSFDWERLGTIVRLATTYLDDILDVNEFPDPAITKAAMATRKLGLGVMGWADALSIMNIRYASDEAVELGDEIMEFINRTAYESSVDTAVTKGAYPTQVGGTAIRNATRTCIAPTGTIALLAGVSSGIEPHFRLKWTREMGDGTILNEEATVLKESNGFVPATADEVSWEWHILHQAAFQKNTDLAVSKTINMPNNATVEDVKNAYIMMWETKCKGGTIFRDGCRENQVLRDTVHSNNLKDDSGYSQHRIESPAAIDFLNDVSAPYSENLGTEILEYSTNGNGRKKLPTNVETIRHKMTLGGMEAYLFAGKYDDGRVGEIFITASKEGTQIAGLFDSIAILLSLALQRGETTAELSAKFAGTRFEPSGLTGNSKIPMATSPIDYIVRWLDMEFGDGNGHDNSDAGMHCPDCDSRAYLSGGCVTCTDERCAWSKCG